MKSIRWQDDETLKDADPAALRLLERGAPENGVDFAPWWESQLATMRAAGLPPAPPSPRFAAPPRRRALAWRYACVLLAGGLLGGGVHAMFAPAPAPLAKCQYQPNEQKAMFAVLEAPLERRAEAWQANASVLTTCSACHVSLRSARSGWNQR
jgi:hypothetical protein